jgi:hypothetical protein
VPALSQDEVDQLAVAGQEQPRSALVAAVLANVEDGFCRDLSRAEFRELVAARRRTCDEALLGLRAAALGREAEPAGAALEAENARLRKLVAEQRAEIERLKLLSRPRRG